MDGTDEEDWGNAFGVLGLVFLLARSAALRLSTGEGI